MPTDKRQRQKEQRAARKEAERKAAARKELIRRILIALGLGGAVALALLAASVFAGRDSLPGAYADYRELPTACGAEAPPIEAALTFDSAADQGLGTAKVIAVIDTSCGPITIELANSDFPATANSFVFLAREGFYDGTVFHRIVEGFVVQGGDPQASGVGGPGYRLPDEFPEAGFRYEKGVVAMANAGRGSTGSQFFIVLGDQATDLPPTFNVLGSVVSGFDTLDKIAAVPTARQSASVEESKPLEAAYIERVTIEVDS